MSSGRKKKPITTQCRYCGAFFLTRDWENHVNYSESSSPVSIARKELVVREDEQLKQIPSTSCNFAGYIDGKVRMVQPGKGMVLLGHILEKREKYFPTELRGWERRNCALVNPETLAQLGSPARSVVLMHFQICPGNVQEYRILILWPNSEIPQLSINIVDCRSSISKFSPVRTVRSTNRISLKPINLAEFPPSFGAKLSNLSHFPLFIKSYLYGAFISKNVPIEVLYYGKTLIFTIQNLEKVDEDEKILEELDSKIENISLYDDEDEELPPIFRIHPDAVFSVLWEESQEDLR